MHDAHGNPSGGQRPQPKSRRWYGYVDVVTPPNRVAPRPTPPAPSAAQQLQVSGISERAAMPSAPTQAAHVASPDQEPVWPAAQSPEPIPTPEPAALKIHKQPTTNLGIRVTILYVLAGILFVAGGLIAWQGFSANRLVEQQIAETNDAADNDGSRPATTPVDDASINQYVVAPNLPRVLTIEKLGIKARIMPLGVTADNKLKAPSNIHDVGWYNASSQPGEPGAMLMDGHVSSWTSDGVFKNLKKLVPGDVVTVERGDGQKLQFRVVKSQAYDEAQTDMRAALKPITEGKNGLNLITCYGRVRPGTSEFEQRLIVFAEQI